MSSTCQRHGDDLITLGEKVTKQSLLELARAEQLRERQEMEKKLQKLVKNMDYLERAKREEEAPLIEDAFKRRLVKEASLHEQEYQQEVEASRLRHDGDLKEKERLSRMLKNKNIFQERILSRRQAEYNRLIAEAREKMEQVKRANKEARETRRKLLYFLRGEEERQRKAREEEEARKRQEEERRKKEEAERKAKLDEIAEKQRQREREIEERARLEREALLGKAVEPKPFDLGGARPVEPQATAAAAAPTTGKYVPRHRRGEATPVAPPPSEPDRSGDKWRGGGPRTTSWSSTRPSR